MTTQIMDLLIIELDERLGNRPFYTLAELTTLGIFGSRPGARMVLRKGQLTFIKISPRRFVIPRSVLLEFLRNNIFEGVEERVNDSNS